jgi:hypothetical protein
MAIEKLKAFEKEFDDLVVELPLLKNLPIRAILTYIHVVVDALLYGSTTLPQHLRLSQRAAGESLMEKLSYVVPLVARCDRNAIGADSADVLLAAYEVDPTGEQLKTLIAHSQFSAIMPDVWRGNYNVEEVSENTFLLTHLSDEYSKFEILDIVMSELTIPFVAKPPPPYRDRFEQIKGDLNHDMPIVIGLARAYTQHFLENVVEMPIMSDEGYRAAVGVSRHEFERFRSALLGIATACRGVARVLGRRRQLRPGNRAIQNEELEWISVNWTANFFQGCLMALSNLSGEAIDSLLPLFSIDFRTDEPRLAHAADGYFPPIAWIQNSVFFNPSLLQAFLPARNILYALNRLDVDRFNNLVSSHMEPELLCAAVAIFQRIENVCIVQNVIWKDGKIAGEIDLLVFSPTENVLLHVQAKAAIPPQGARMIKALEGRIDEATKQLNRFRDLPQHVIDGIVTSATDQQVKGVRVIDVILTRSSCGTHRIWKKLNGVVTVNPPLLNVVLNRLGKDKPSEILGRFPEFVAAEIERLMSVIRPKWVHKNLDCGTALLKVPMLEYDRQKMDRERASTAHPNA